MTSTVKKTVTANKTDSTTAAMPAQRKIRAFRFLARVLRRAFRRALAAARLGAGCLRAGPARLPVGGVGRSDLLVPIGGIGRSLLVPVGGAGCRVWEKDGLPF
ncbi:MAG: hypothetical protein MR018_06880 [Clostridiales bacterium]|nr:hypothetical protein [Clostridiales bacterium]